MLVFDFLDEEIDETPKARSEKVIVEQRTFRRVQIEADSDRIRTIVRMVSPLFDSNPRRLKQFTNTFRLALYISSDLGLFDGRSTTAPLGVPPQVSRPIPTPEQLGKFVALLLRFPDLRFILGDKPNWLALLEEEAIRLALPPKLDPIFSDEASKTEPISQAPYAQWLDKRGAQKLLTTQLDPANPTSVLPTYSLRNFDPELFLSILPRAPRPPATTVTPPPATSVPTPATRPDLSASVATAPNKSAPPSEAAPDQTESISTESLPQTEPDESVSSSSEFAPQLNDEDSSPDDSDAPPDSTATLQSFAAAYEQIRENEPGGNARTIRMNALVTAAIRAAEPLPQRQIRTMIRSLEGATAPGQRLLRIVLAYARPDPSGYNFDLLLRMLDDVRSPFEHYWTIQTLTLYVEHMSTKEKRRVNDILQTHWEQIVADPGRFAPAQRLRELASRSASFASA